MLVVVLREAVDFSDEVLDAFGSFRSRWLLGNESEPALDLIDPGGVSGRVVDVESWFCRQPEAHLGVLVGRVVVDDEVDVECLGHGLIDALEEAEELLMAVTRPTLGEHRAGGDVECGKQRGGAVADIIVGDAFDIAKPHRQHRLGAIEG